MQKENDHFELYDHIYAATLYTSLMNIIAHFLSLHIDDAIGSKEIVLGQQGSSTYPDGHADIQISTHHNCPHTE